MSRMPTATCPHCASPASGRTSTQITPVYREVTYVCRNEKCGHSFVVAIQAIRTLSPSAIPNPEVNLPLSRSIRRRELVVQLERALEADDEPQLA